MNREKAKRRNNSRASREQGQGATNFFYVACGLYVMIIIAFILLFKGYN